MPKMTFSIELELVTCADCGMHFAVPPHWIKHKREATRPEERSFKCPAGHPLTFRESLYDKVSTENSRLKQQLAQRDDEIVEERRRAEREQHRADAERKSRVKLQKRAAGGACPCCNRSFVNMARHMKTQHPEFRAEALKVVK